MQAPTSPLIPRELLEDCSASDLNHPRQTLSPSHSLLQFSLHNTHAQCSQTCCHSHARQKLQSHSFSYNGCNKPSSPSHAPAASLSCSLAPYRSKINGNYDGQSTSEPTGTLVLHGIGAARRQQQQHSTTRAWPFMVFRFGPLASLSASTPTSHGAPGGLSQQSHGAEARSDHDDEADDGDEDEDDEDEDGSSSGSGGGDEQGEVWQQHATVGGSSTSGSSSSSSRSSAATASASKTGPGLDDDDEGSESTTELGESTMEELASVSCAHCKGVLVQAASRSGRRNQRNRRIRPSALRICDGCHRCFHAACCEGLAVVGNKSASKPGSGSNGKSKMWFHDAACMRSHRTLQAAAMGSARLIPGRPAHSLEVVSTSVRPSMTNSRADSSPGSGSDAKYDSLEAAMFVLGREYGTWCVNYVDGSDYALLLRHQQQPSGQAAQQASKAHADAAATAAAAAAAVAAGKPTMPLPALSALPSSSAATASADGPAVAGSATDALAGLYHPEAGGLAVAAATLDMYGSDYGKVDMISTVPELRLQGHSAALLQGLEDLLRQAGTSQLMMVVDKGDKDAEALWRKHFGFKPLGGRQLKQLEQEFPHVAHYRKTSVLMARPVAGLEQGQHGSVAGLSSEQQNQQRGTTHKPCRLQKDAGMTPTSEGPGPLGRGLRAARRLLSLGLWK